MNRLLEYFVTRGVTAGDVILNTLLVIIGLMIAYALWTLHKKNGVYTNFNLVHLIVNKDGFPDGAKCIELGTFVLLSWGFIVYVTAKTLPEWYMQTFIVTFVVRGGFGAYLRSKTPPEQSGTTTTTNTSVQTKEIKQENAT